MLVLRSFTDNRKLILMDGTAIISKPGIDDNLLTALKSHLKRKTDIYLNEVHESVANAEVIDLQLIDENEFISVYKRCDKEYVIELGNSFIYAAFNLSDSIKSKMAKYFITNKLSDIRDFCFNYIFWLTLHHELMHISLGHVDFIEEKGERGYLEVFGKHMPILHLSSDIAESRDIWRAFETEADGYATSAALASFRYINHLQEWARWSISDVLIFHGVMNCSLFNLFYILTENSDDFKHLKPSIRQYITLPCLDKLAEKTGYSKEQFTEIVTKSSLETLVSVFNFDVNVNDAMAGYSWMSRLDAILKKSQISKYRRYSKRGIK